MFFPTLLDLHEKVRSVVPLSILFLEYSRAPAAKYPVQLEEAVSAYRYLIESLKVGSSDIILGGDSAGGHLALQLLQHIQTPHPFSRRVPDARPLPRPSKCIFISPWLALKQTAPSFVSNELYDAIPSSLLRRWAAQWADNHEDQWTNPLDFDTNWGDIVPPSLVISGQQELLIDDIKKFCSQLKQVPSIITLLTLRAAACWWKTIDMESLTTGGGPTTSCMDCLITPEGLHVMKQSRHL